MMEVLKEELATLPISVLDRLVDFADGYPRIAILLAENYLAGNQSDEDIIAINDENLINKLIAGRLDTNSIVFDKNKRVLMGLSLFQKVGYREPILKEAKWVADLVRIDWFEFEGIIGQQKRRGIIQGDYYIYVTPYVLAVNLAKEWWQNHGNGVNLDDLINSMPSECKDDLSHLILSQLPFLSTVHSGRKLVESLLSSEGIFEDGSLLQTDFGSRLFQKLAEADPGLSLNCLKRTIGTWSKDRRLGFTTGRRMILLALQQIAVWKEYFQEAARLLLLLAEAENENYSNNASGIFADLFIPAPGQLSCTEAPPEERFVVLKEAFNSNSIEQRKLSLSAMKQSLKASHFFRMVGPEYQGAHRLPEMWRPKNTTEINEHFYRVWSFLEQAIENNDELKDECLNIFLGSAIEVASVNKILSKMVRQSIKKMKNNPGVDKTRVMETILTIIHYDSNQMDKEENADWIALREDFVGSSFTDQLLRYVGTYVIEDLYTDGKYDQKNVDAKIDNLAVIALRNNDLLETEYSWLTTAKAKKGYQFGYALGKHDNDSLLLPRIISAQIESGLNGTPGFLSGYLKTLFDRDITMWESALDHISSIDSLKKFLPELMWGSGITDRSASKLISMVDTCDIKVNSLEIFTMGGYAKKFADGTFSKFIQYLMEQSNNGSIIALELVFARLHKEDILKVDEKIILKILLKPVFWGANSIQTNSMIQYYWKVLAEILIKNYPEAKVALVDKLL